MCIVLYKKYDNFKEIPQLFVLLRGAEFKYESAISLIESHTDLKHRPKFVQMVKFINSNPSLLHYLQKVTKSVQK